MPPSFAQHSPSQQPRETIFDRIIHLEPHILDIPPAPCLCDHTDSIKRLITIGDTRLYVELEGRGTPVVLLHGGPGGTHHYFHPDFSRAAADTLVIYYDQRGCGRSDYISGSGYTIEQAAADLDALRSTLNIAAWVVLGHSYGGFLAQYYSTRYPERVLGLILVCSRVANRRPLRPSREHDFLSQAEIARIQAIYNRTDVVFAEETDTAGELSLAEKLYNAFVNGDWKRQNYYKPSSERMAQTALYDWKHDAHFNSIINQDAATIDLDGAFHHCPIPTLLLEGRWDLCWNVDKPAALQQDHPQAHLTTFEHSGHFPFQDEPEAFFQAVNAFVKRCATIPLSDIAAWKADLARWQSMKSRLKYEKTTETP
jgi:proline iminopeptidase